ncbi:hypothetical protein E4A44_27595 [Escherichia coli]|nr:hypothetical protein [Escherichia coli]
MSKRTTYCGLVTEAFLGQEITLKGWVNNRRDLGGLIFVDLRDREGIVQVVFNPAFSEEALKIAETVLGTNLLGVKTVIAQSYERIHRSNLVMMGVLPLEFKKGESADSLGLDGTEEISVNIDENVQPHDYVRVTAKKQDGDLVEFDAMVRFDSLVEMDYYRHGGILQMVLRNKLAQ